MTDFVFHSVPTIRVQTGGAAQLSVFLNDIHRDGTAFKRVLVVTDKGVRGLGLLDGALDSMTAAGVEAVVFDEVIADPPDHVVLAAAQAARDCHADAVIGFGGGSPMDTAKVVAALAAGAQSLQDMYGVEKVRGPRLPLALIPTTAGTGSEVTQVAIITTGETTKAGISSPILFADLVILDPLLTLGLPPNITAYTGIDAMVHAIEAFTSRIKKNPLSDASAITALKLLFGAIGRAYDDGADVEARRDMLLGAMLAGQAFANAPVGGVHAMAYPLGGSFHVPHGLSNAVVLTEVLKFNAESAADLYAALASEIDQPATAAGLINALEQVIDDCGIEPRLSQFGVSHNHLPGMAEEVAGNARLLPNNPRELTYKDALRLYGAIL